MGNSHRAKPHCLREPPSTSSSVNRLFQCRLIHKRTVFFAFVNTHYVYLNAMSTPVNSEFMSTSGTRLRGLLDERGIAYSEFAAALGVEPQHVNNWFKRGIPKARVFAIADALAVNPRWLSDGTDSESPSNSLATGGESSLLSPLDPWDDRTPLEPDEVEVPLYKEVELSAGAGRTAVREIKGRKLRFSYATLRNAGVSPSAAFCATVSGNSMEPLIMNGATIGVDKSATRILDGEIYALEHDGMLRVKYLYRLPAGGMRLRSFNTTEHPDEEYSAEQIETQQIRILGWVFWWSTLRKKKGLAFDQ
ncbi:XRE family transcriptional regulator [Pseudomonas aeruginosa]|uniref:XRE family transcriptional regulator n=2 Tax=Pseudomonas TaxID=286 RepID=UPI0039F238AB